MNEEKTVDAVISATHDLLVRHNYSANDIAARYTRIWKRFKVYAVQQGEEMFSADLADRYLSETYHFPQEYVHFPGIYSSYRANRSGYGRSKESIAQYMRTAENFLDFVEGCGVTD